MTHGPGPVALAGLRVVELGEGIAAPFAARLLADLGADVVKVEAPAGGDATRRLGPLLPRAGHSALFEYLNWNKRSVALDLADPRLAALLAGADIVISGLEPAAARAHGLDLAGMRRHAPASVLVSVTGFGGYGPYADRAATDLVLQAMSGIMAISGAQEREPLKHGLRTSFYSAGLNAAYAALAGHVAALRTGEGVDIDVSIHECMASELVMNEAYLVFTGVVQGRPPASPDPFDGHPLATADGFVSLQTSAQQETAQFAKLFGDARLADERFATAEGRVRHATELRAILDEHLREERAVDLFLRACEDGLLSGAVQGAGDLLACPHLEARGAFVEIDEHTPDGTPWRFPAVLGRLSATPTTVSRRAPSLGAHTAEVLAEPGRSRVPRVVSTPVGGGPLAGLRVLDLSVIFAVPYMGALLADLGAEVIKLEAPHRLDQTRTDWGGFLNNDPGEEPWNRSGTFHVVNRGKRSVGIDLSTDAGRDVLRQLVATSDVLIDNFTPRVMRGWGTTYADLRQHNPRLLMLSNTGYGSTGPWAAFKAQGTTLEATMGLMGVTGYRGGEPARAGQSTPDFLACWSGLLALLAALIHRDRTGQGQWIDLGMYQLGPAVIPEALIHRQAVGADPARVGAEDLESPLSGVLPTADGWLAVTVQDGAQAAALDQLVGVGPAADRRLRLETWLLAHTAAAAAAALQARGIPAGPVYDAAQLLSDPHLAARGFYETVTVDALGGSWPLIGRPFTWGPEHSGPAIRAGGPAFAEANADVARDLLGLDEDAVAALYAAGVLVDAPVRPPAGRPMDLEARLASGAITRMLAPSPEEA